LILISSRYNSLTSKVGLPAMLVPFSIEVAGRKAFQFWIETLHQPPSGLVVPCPEKRPSTPKSHLGPGSRSIPPFYKKNCLLLIEYPTGQYPRTGLLGARGGEGLRSGSVPVAVFIQFAKKTSYW